MFLPLLCALALVKAPAVESQFEQVAPAPADGWWSRSKDQTRAVVLLHGFRYQLTEEAARRASLHAWQRPDSTLVRELAHDSDVFSFAYGQDAHLGEIVSSSGLADGVARLRRLGYRDIVLLGHSAGGLVARQFVEDHPEAGVTKVIQVCSPNGGSPKALVVAVKNQQAFLDCLTPQGRVECLRARAAVRIPDGVEFVCVVGRDGTRDTDGVVPCGCQWTEDLQKQGIPAVRVGVNHHMVVRSTRGVKPLADLVRQRQPRWPAERIKNARQEILGN